MHISHLKILSVPLLILLALASVIIFSCSTDKASPEKYFCPMHPQVISDHPGKCPICGMDLVKSEPTTEVQKVEKYTCPMHPEVISDHPGKCPICKMDLVKKEVTGGSAANTDSPAGLSPVSLDSQALELAGVQTVKAESGRLNGTIRTVGTVVADETRVRHVQTKVNGWVEKLYANFIGQAVKKGAPILSLYSPELLAGQEEYLRALKNASTFKDSSIPEVQQGGKDLLDAARRRLLLFDVPESFITDLEGTGKSRRTVTLVAPVGGYVTSKNIFEGTRVEPGMELFTVTDLSRVWIDADIYEYEARAIKKGQEATLSPTYDPQAKITAKIDYIYPEINPETRTLKIRFNVPNKDLTLKPAMFVNAEIETAGEDGVIIPESAVIDTGRRQVVFVERSPGSFEPREIRIAGKADGKITAASGVTAGETVVVRANFLLDSESRLRSALSETSAPASHEHGDGP